MKLIIIGYLDNSLKLKFLYVIKPEDFKRYGDWSMK